MEAAMQIHLQEDDFILPQNEKIVVNKETSAAKNSSLVVLLKTTWGT